MTQDNLQSTQQRLEIRDRQINAVHRISEALFSKTDLDSLLGETLRVSLETVDADAGSLLLYDETTHRLVFRYVIGGSPDLVGVEIDPEADQNGRAATAFRTGEAIFTDTVADPTAYNPSIADATGYATSSILTVPLKSGEGKPIGVMQALNKRQGRFDSEDRELLEIVSSLASVSLVNARLTEEAQLAAIARAVGDLGHDIKNALTPIQTGMATLAGILEQMYAELDPILADEARSHPELVAQVRDSLSLLRELYPDIELMVQDGSADIKEMVGEIADYIKGTQATHRVLSSLKEVVEERLRRLTVLARDRRVALCMEGLEDVPPFAFDRRLLSRAIFNLVNNALGAISDAVKRGQIEPRSFNVRVRAEAVANGDFPDGGYCLISVQDDGPGIPLAIRERLFTPQALSTTPGGTGIGTRFVRDVAHAHGGLVGVESEPGQGATFWIKLPLAAN